jgi:hypothetical protein
MAENFNMEITWEQGIETSSDLMVQIWSLVSVAIIQSSEIKSICKRAGLLFSAELFST